MAISITALVLFDCVKQQTYVPVQSRQHDISAWRRNEHVTSCQSPRLNCLLQNNRKQDATSAGENNASQRFGAKRKSKGRWQSLICYKRGVKPTTGSSLTLVSPSLLYDVNCAPPTQRWDRRKSQPMDANSGRETMGVGSDSVPNPWSCIIKT